MIEEKFVETKWGNVYYLECGTGKKTVIFIHGWLGWPVMIKRLARRFNNEDYRIIAPYLPGHGLSFPFPKNYSFKDLVATIDEFLKKLDIRQSDLLIGHSVGGAVAWELAMADHDTRKLVLIDALLEYTGRSIPSLISSLVVDKSRDVFKMWRRNSDETKPELGIGVRHPRFASPLKFWGILKTVRISEITKVKDLPVLVLWGESDNMVPMRDYTKVLSQPGIKIQTFPGGHYWFGWQQNAMLTAIDNFLNQ